MNITLREVYQTNPDGDRFWKLKECYIRGSTVRFVSSCSATVSTARGGPILTAFFFFSQIKYLRVPDVLLDTVKEEQNRARDVGRNSRGGHIGGLLDLSFLFFIADSDLVVQGEEVPEVQSLYLYFDSFWPAKRPLASTWNTGRTYARREGAWTRGIAAGVLSMLPPIPYRAIYFRSLRLIITLSTISTSFCRPSLSVV